MFLSSFTETLWTTPKKNSKTNQEHRQYVRTQTHSPRSEGTKKTISNVVNESIDLQSWGGLVFQLAFIIQHSFSPLLFHHSLHESSASSAHAKEDDLSSAEIDKLILLSNVSHSSCTEGLLLLLLLLFGSRFKHCLATSHIVSSSSWLKCLSSGSTKLPIASGVSRNSFACTMQKKNM